MSSWCFTANFRDFFRSFFHANPEQLSTTSKKTETNYMNVFSPHDSDSTIPIYPLSSYILHQSMCQTSHNSLLVLSNRVVVIIPMIMQIHPVHNHSCWIDFTVSNEAWNYRIPNLPYFRWYQSRHGELPSAVWAYVSFSSHFLPCLQSKRRLSRTWVIEIRPSHRKPATTGTH